MSKDIIEQLKKNLARFANMSDDMANAAVSIGLVHFKCLQDDGGWYGDFSVRSDGFQPHCRYRLKADYEPEQEIEGDLVLPAILVKLEEIRCGLIDVESAIEKGKQNE